MILFFLILFFSFELVKVTVMENLLRRYVAEAPRRGGLADKRYYGSHLASREVIVVWHKLLVVVVYECRLL
jgi:hypothetical protein